MPAPIRPPLIDVEVLAQAQWRYEVSTDADLRRRYQIILLAYRGLTAPRIARIVFCDEKTVLRVLKRFRSGGLDAIARQTSPGRPRLVTEAWESELVRVIERDPHELGVLSANWTTELLAVYLGQQTGMWVSPETVRVYLHAHGYVCKRPIWSLRRKASEQAGYVGNRLRIEVLLAAASTPEPLPLEFLVEVDLWSELPTDVPELLALLPRADLYLQDEVQFAFHPTLTRVWSQKGRRGQRLVEAPGQNRKVYGFGLLDWRDGWFDGRIAPGRTADVFCQQVRAAVDRSGRSQRVAIIIADNLKIHTAPGSLLVRRMLTELRDQLVLVYTPAYDPDANRIEWLWRLSRRLVTHNHQRSDFEALVADVKAHFETLSRTPEQVLRQIGSPYTPDHRSAKLQSQSFSRAA